MKIMFSYRVDVDGNYVVEIEVNGRECEVVDKGRIINQIIESGETERNAVDMLGASLESRLNG